MNDTDERTNQDIISLSGTTEVNVEEGIREKRNNLGHWIQTVSI